MVRTRPPNFKLDWRPVRRPRRQLIRFPGSHRRTFDNITIDQDSDGDGLWDAEEATYGTDPRLADTDGDGYSDFDEINQLGSDPLVFDGMTIGELVAHNSGSEAAVRAGSWKQNGSALHAMDYRGELEYLLDVPVDGYYRLDLTIREAAVIAAPVSSSSTLNSALCLWPRSRPFQLR